MWNVLFKLLANSLSTGDILMTKKSAFSGDNQWNAQTCILEIWYKLVQIQWLLNILVQYLFRYFKCVLNICLKLLYKKQSNGKSISILIFYVYQCIKIYRSHLSEVPKTCLIFKPKFEDFQSLNVSFGRRMYLLQALRTYHLLCYAIE